PRIRALLGSSGKQASHGSCGSVMCPFAIFCGDRTRVNRMVIQHAPKIAIGVQFDSARQRRIPMPGADEIEDGGTRASFPRVVSTAFPEQATAVLKYLEQRFHYRLGWPVDRKCGMFFEAMTTLFGDYGVSESGRVTPEQEY